MPYASNAELPETVRNALPAEGQSTFRTIVNSALEQYGDEGKAMATAWAGLRNAGWKKVDGTWQKVEKGNAFEIPLTISKVDADQQLVFGWLSVSEDESGNLIVDLQNDIITPDELEKAAYDYVLHARAAGEMHQREVRTKGDVAFAGLAVKEIGRLVESMAFTKDKTRALGIPDGVLPTGWWVGYKIDDKNAWEKVKSGEYRAFSIGGRAKRKKVV